MTFGLVSGETWRRGRGKALPWQGPVNFGPGIGIRLPGQAPPVRTHVAQICAPRPLRPSWEHPKGVERRV